MRHTSIILSAVLAVLSVVSCRRDEIEKINNLYHIDYDINDSVLYNKPKTPELIWLRFYNPTTNRQVKEMLAYPAGSDFSIAPGTYNIVAYTYQNTATKITYTDDFSILTAETDASSSQAGVINGPSHVYIGQLRNFHLPAVNEAEAPYMIRMPMCSPMDSWRIIVDGVQNLEYANALTFYVTNQYRDLLFKDYEGEGEAVLAFVGDIYGSNIIADFNTFGMLEDRDYQVQIVITDAANYEYRKSVDVTDQILDPENTQHIIRFTFDAVLQTMVQGGLEPSAEEWKTEREHWTLQ